MRSEAGEKLLGVNWGGGLPAFCTYKGHPGKVCSLFLAPHHRKRDREEADEFNCSGNHIFFLLLFPQFVVSAGEEQTYRSLVSSCSAFREFYGGDWKKTSRLFEEQGMWLPSLGPPALPTSPLESWLPIPFPRNTGPSLPILPFLAHFLPCSRPSLSAPRLTPRPSCPHRLAWSRAAPR